MGSQCDTCIFGNTSMKEICSGKSNASTFLHLTETTLPHRDFREANFYYVPEINACTFFTIVLIFVINTLFRCIDNQITSIIVMLIFSIIY